VANIFASGLSGLGEKKMEKKILLAVDDSRHSDFLLKKHRQQKDVP